MAKVDKKVKDAKPAKTAVKKVKEGKKAVKAKDSKKEKELKKPPVKAKENGTTDDLQTLHRTAFNFPAIDNNGHPLLLESQRDAVPFEELFEADFGDAMKDVPFTVPALHAVTQMGKVLGLNDPTWDDIKRARSETGYTTLCEMYMNPTKIAGVLLDEGPAYVAEMAHDWTWHTRFGCTVRRVVRIETSAEDIMEDIMERGDALTLESLVEEYTNLLDDNASREEVVAFKSSACYRTGLDISLSDSDEDVEACLSTLSDEYAEKGAVRLVHKPLNDYLVRICLDVAAQYNKPVQFHTGLADKEITLTRSSPAHMQPLIAAHPETTFVLLHSSYPYTRDDGYLTLIYSNVFLDFGDMFPAISGHSQQAVIRQMFATAPTNKILWSTDSHWFPESYYLGSLQSRQALFTVLSEMIQAGELTEKQAVAMVENVLFHNSNRVYGLKLDVPDW
ncbi:amidohydrolase 2 [Hymenopellis radicata]|nr:amidohydrolase 2 [Hymenopellis radicata]